MADTHINAYKQELVEAEQAEAEAHNRVVSLKEQIAVLEGGEQPASEAESLEAKPKTKAKAKAKAKKAPAKKGKK